MLSILEDHLLLTEPPAMMELYLRAHNLFDLYDLENYQDGFDAIMMVNTSGVSMANNDAIRFLTMQNLKTIMVEHGIRLSDEAPMLAYVQCLEFIRQIENTEFLQQCRDTLLNEEMDNIEKWALLIELTTGVEVETTIEHLEEVTDAVIKATLVYFTKREAFETVAVTADPNYARMCSELALFSRTVGGSMMRCHQHLFEESGITGMPFSYYWGIYNTYFLSLAHEDLIYECIGFAIISADGLDNPQKTIMHTLQEVIGDIEELTKIQIILSQTLVKYRNEVSSGVSKVIQAH
jgi:hypothetical protein